MKNSKIHIIIGTLICAVPLVLFLVFSNRLPENVPIQFTIDGSAGNTLPKSLFIFGMPAIFVVVNLINGFSLVKKENVAVYRFYIIPGIALIISVATLLMALSM